MTDSASFVKSCPHPFCTLPVCSLSSSMDLPSRKTLVNVGQTSGYSLTNLCIPAKERIPIVSIRPMISSCPEPLNALPVAPSSPLFKVSSNPSSMVASKGPCILMNVRNDTAI